MNWRAEKNIEVFSAEPRNIFSFFQGSQTEPGAHTESYSMGSGVSFLGINQQSENNKDAFNSDRKYIWRHFKISISLCQD